MNIDAMEDKYRLLVKETARQKVVMRVALERVQQMIEEAVDD